MTKFVLATHVWGNGPAQALRKYLIDKRVDFLWVEHPLFYSDSICNHSCTVFTQGKKFKKKDFLKFKFPQPVDYVLSVFLNIFFVFLYLNKNETVYVGYNCLNAISGILLKNLGKVSRVVYCVVDYVPKRFDSKFLNTIYHKIDQFCIRNADETWNLNESAMNAARKKYYGFDAYKQGYSLQKNVPMGFWKDRISLKEFDAIHKRQIVFTGYLYKKQGVQYVVKALPLVLKKIPDVKFVIIGEGDYLEELKNLVKKLKLLDVVEFKGFMKLEDLEKVLVESALAVALYSDKDPETNFTYYSDPSKIKDYLGCGLPILISNVPTIAKDISDNACGTIIDTDPKTIAEVLIEILQNNNKLKTYRANVLEYREQFDWNAIFEGVIGPFL